jgi:hypothetical protein
LICWTFLSLEVLNTCDLGHFVAEILVANPCEEIC